MDCIFTSGYSGRSPNSKRWVSSSSRFDTITFIKLFIETSLCATSLEDLVSNSIVRQIILIEISTTRGHKSVTYLNQTPIF